MLLDGQQTRENICDPKLLIIKAMKSLLTRTILGNSTYREPWKNPTFKAEPAGPLTVLYSGPSVSHTQSALPFTVLRLVTVCSKSFQVSLPTLKSEHALACPKVCSTIQSQLSQCSKITFWKSPTPVQLTYSLFLVPFLPEWKPISSFICTYFYWMPLLNVLHLTIIEEI